MHNGRDCNPPFLVSAVLALVQISETISKLHAELEATVSNKPFRTLLFPRWPERDDPVSTVYVPAMAADVEGSKYLYERLRNS